MLTTVTCAYAIYIPQPPGVTAVAACVCVRPSVRPSRSLDACGWVGLCSSRCHLFLFFVLGLVFSFCFVLVCFGLFRFVSFRSVFLVASRLPSVCDLAVVVFFWCFLSHFFVHIHVYDDDV